MTRLEARRRQDIVQLAFLALILAGTAAIFVVNPAFSTPTLLAIVISMLLSPAVAALERRGWSRTRAITVVFLAIGATVGGLAYWATNYLFREWESFRANAPAYFEAGILQMRTMEQGMAERYPVLASAHITDSILAWGQGTGRWFIDNGASMVGSLLTASIISPALAFVLLNDGRRMRAQVFSLVPNRFFESFFWVTSQISRAISDYLTAKLLEAFLVCLMTTAGLVLIRCPYALVLGVVAGVTNIVPYLGPVIGIAPALLVALFDRSGQGLVVPVIVVYVLANVVDTLVIFPVVVAKLVNLNPLLLIAVVAIGQQYYGLVGMLVSIPIATACKVILTEVHRAIYGARVDATAAADPGEGVSA